MCSIAGGGQLDFNSTKSQNLPTANTEENQFNGLSLSESWNKLRKDHNDVIFPSQNLHLTELETNQMERSFQRSLIASNLLEINYKQTASKLIKILNEVANIIKTDGTQKAIDLFKHFYRSEIRPIKDSRSLIIDISAGDRLILDFNLLEKGVIAPIYAGEPHDEKWYWR